MNERKKRREEGRKQHRRLVGINRYGRRDVKNEFKKKN